MTYRTAAIPITLNDLPSGILYSRISVDNISTDSERCAVPLL